MRQKLLILLAGVMIAGSAPAVDVFNTTFEDGLTTGWTLGEGVTVTALPYETGKPTDSSKCVTIPQSKSATKETVASGAAKAWTDFYIIPQPFFSYTDQSPAKVADATAQIYVSNGVWYTISGADVNGVARETVLGGGTYPTVAPNTFYHVSIYTDYSATPKNWSLFVNNLPIAANLPLISTAPATTEHMWVKINNLSGGSAYLDDCQVTPDAPSGVNSQLVPGTDVPMWVALVGFGTTENPKPILTTVAVANGGTATFNFTPDVSGGAPYYGGYSVLGGTNTGAMTVDKNSGRTLDVNQNLTAFTATDLGGSDLRYFYRVIRSNNGVAVTNETYAAYKKPWAANAIYMTGIPVTYQSGKNKFSSDPGNQLKLGLANGDQVTIMGADGVKTTFALDGSKNWFKVGADGGDLNTEFTAGAGVLFKASAAQGNTYFAGLKTTSNPVVSILAGVNWAYMSWAKDDVVMQPGILPTLAASTGDYLHIQTAGSTAYTTAKYVGGAWRNGLLGTGGPVTWTLKAGDGVLYFNSTGAAKTWNQ